MWNAVKNLDRILRGDATQLSSLRQGTIETPAGGLSMVIVALAMIYGVCMGCYALFRDADPAYLRHYQLLATTLKVPALFFLTLVVTFPSLYVFNALVGSRLSVVSVWRLLIASLAVNLAVLASLGPIVAFFSVTTTSYPFMVLLNVFVFGVSGSLGLVFLMQTLHRLSVAYSLVEPPSVPKGPPADPPEDPPEEAQKEAQDEAQDEADPPAENQQPQPLDAEVVRPEVVDEPGALDRLAGHVLGKHVKTVFACWIVVFGWVGAQMGWVLRPFIGNPNQPFEPFRLRESNFFEAVLETIRSLFS